MNDAPDWRDTAQALGRGVEAYRDACAQIIEILHRNHEGHRRGVPWTSCKMADCVGARAILRVAADRARKPSGDAMVCSTCEQEIWSGVSDCRGGVVCGPCCDEIEKG